MVSIRLGFEAEDITKMENDTQRELSSVEKFKSLLEDVRNV